MRKKKSNTQLEDAALTLADKQAEIDAATLEKLNNAEAANQDAIDAAELARSRSLEDAALALARKRTDIYANEQSALTAALTAQQDAIDDAERTRLQRLDDAHIARERKLSDLRDKELASLKEHVDDMIAERDRMVAAVDRQAGGVAVADQQRRRGRPCPWRGSAVKRCAMGMLSLCMGIPPPTRMVLHLSQDLRSWRY